MTTTSNTAMAAAFAQAGLIDHAEIPTVFASQRVAQTVAFYVSAEYGKAATRIQKLANPAKGATPDSLREIAIELRECLAKLVWGIDNLGDAMRPIDECITEWAGGGFSKPASESDIKNVADALGISTEAAKLTADANRINRTNYLAIRRKGQTEPMIAAIQRELGKLEEGMEPDTEIIMTACQKAFQNAVLWGDWAEAALAKADMVYHCGKSPTLPELDQTMQDKAGRIREELSRRQEEQAAKDAAALMAFDLDQLAA